MRAAAGEDTFLLGCGVPLGSAVGLFDGMRIGADTAGTWAPNYLGISPFFQAEPHMPSLRNALQNTFTRSAMHQRWWFNDPDCLLVRPDTKLTLAEVQSQAAAIAITGGMLLLSDNLPALPSDRLRIVEVLLPLIGQRARVLDLFDRETPAHLRLDLDGPGGSWSVLAAFNRNDSPADLLIRADDFHLEENSYRLRSFWDGKLFTLTAEEELIIKDVPAHGVVVLAARSITSTAQYLGSDLHISQGMELASWADNPGGVSFRLALPRVTTGRVCLWLPSPPPGCRSRGKTLPLSTLAMEYGKFLLTWTGKPK